MNFNPIELVRNRYRKWQERRFLKKHHCDSWFQYHRRYDPDTSQRANDINNWYHGYPFVHCIDSHKHHAYTIVYDYGPGGVRYGHEDIYDWCQENCSGKFRLDGHRVFWNRWSQQWEITGFGDEDYIFFAFKDERDYLFFLLRWA